MEIRLATTDDLPVLTKLVGYFWDEQERRFGMPRMDAVTMTLIKHGIATGQAVVVAEEEGGSIVAWTARVMAPGLPKGLAAGIARWTFEPYRRERVSTDMTRFADEHAVACGAEVLTGEVAKDNVPGLRSALADGWEIVGYSIRKKLTERAARDEEVRA